MDNNAKTPVISNLLKGKRASGSKTIPTSEPVGENEPGKETAVLPKGKQKQIPEPSGNISKEKQKSLPDPPATDGEINENPDRTALIRTAQIKCHDIVEQYRKGTKSKIKAILEISSTLGAIPDLSSEDLDGALTEYLGYIDEADREKEIAEKQGRDDEINESGDDDDDDDGTSQGKKRTRSGHTPFRQNRHSISRSRSPSQEPKRKKMIPPSSMPWL
jgi:hypothetical protein